MKERTGRGEGRKPHGTNEGEQAVIEGMKKLRAAGLSFDKIATTLNDEGVPALTAGKRWHGFAINQILNANGRPGTRKR